MRALSLLLFTLVSWPAVAQDTGAPVACKDDNTDCREDCTVEYGTSTRTYNQLGTCLQKCKQTYDKCRERHFALQERQQLGIEPESGPAAPGWEEPKGQQASTPASKSDSGESTGRSGVYRASDSNAVADPSSEADELAKAMEDTPKKEPEKAAKSRASAKSEPAKAPEPGKAEPAATTAATSSDSLADVVPPVPPSPPKTEPKKEPAGTKPPPPKRDIDDWDPNGD